MNKILFIMVLILFALPFVHADGDDAFVDVYVYSDGDIYVNTNLVATNGSVYYDGDYKTVWRGSGFGKENMFDSYSDAIDYFIGYEEMTFVSSYHERWFESMTRFVNKIFDTFEKKYLHQRDIDDDIRKRAIVAIEKRLINNHDAYDYEHSVLCIGAIQTMLARDLNSVSCEALDGTVQKWQILEIGNDKQAIRITDIGD